MKTGKFKLSLSSSNFECYKCKQLKSGKGKLIAIQSEGDKPIKVPVCKECWNKHS